MIRYFFGLLLTGLWLLPPASAAEKPHILSINADDLGVMDVGYNNTAYNRPKLDRLAKEGMAFVNGYAPSGAWKFIGPNSARKQQKGGRNPELFNLEKDAAESRNVIRQHPEVAEAMQRELEALVQGDGLRE